MPILRRVLFADKSVSGILRFSDWAAVTTTSGYMVEPGFCINNRTPVATGLTNFDPTDMMNRVDDIQMIDMLQETTLLSGGAADPPLHGGVTMPRVGK